MEQILVAVATGLIVDLVKKGAQSSYGAIKEAFAGSLLGDDQTADLRGVIKALPAEATPEQIEAHLRAHQAQLPFINFGSNHANTVTVNENNQGVVAGVINGAVTLHNTKE